MTLTLGNDIIAINACIDVYPGCFYSAHKGGGKLCDYKVKAQITDADMLWLS